MTDKKCGTKDALAAFYKEKVDALSAEIWPVIREMGAGAWLCAFLHGAERPRRVATYDHGRPGSVRFRPRVAAVAVIAVWAFLAGSAKIVYEDASFTVEASGWQDLTLSYSDIAAVDYLPAEEVPEGGIRTYGLGNLRVSFGHFSNEAYGDYIRYTYDSCRDCVRLTTAGGRTVLLNGPDQAATRAIFDQLRARTGL